MTKPVFVIGSGGHARVCADALLAAGRKVDGFLENDPQRIGVNLLGIPILDEKKSLERSGRDQIELVLGIGGAGDAASFISRAQIALRLSKDGWRLAGIRHPAAVISPFARIAEDAQVMARAVIQPLANIGSGCIVNTAAVVEHDSIVGEGCHISIGAVLCGAVEIGCQVHVGAGSVIRQGLRIGDNVIIGAGATVVCDQHYPAILVGNPARKLKVS
jgi:sugar O-acyltransferase (sialic acid O-acetyltransferase NeuD family)